MTAPTPIDLEIASQIPVFSGLKPQALAVLLEEASVFNLRAGHALFRQGEPAHAFFIIMEGWIKLYRVTPAGDEAVLNVLTEGESFAEAVTFTSGRYPATACAVTPARVMVIPADHVMSCIREMPDVAIAMIASTSQHLHRMVQQIEQLMAQSATQRVAEFLASLAPCTRGPCTITLPYDKSLIAGRLGLKPESLSRVFAKLRSIGVEVRASNVVVRDMAQLCRLVACDRTKARCPVKPRLICQDQPRPRAVRSEAKPVLA
jgi:CRP-like cAMP-binding protein